MKNIRLLVILIAILSIFCVSCGNDEPPTPDPTTELIEQLFENEDVEFYGIYPLAMSSTESMIRVAVEYYNELRETHPEFIELEGKENSVEKLLDFAEECFDTQEQYGKGVSALWILDRQIFRNQMSPSERERFENICIEKISYKDMEWYNEENPEN